MSPILELTEENYGEALLKAFAKAEAFIVAAEPLFDISGSKLADVANMIPLHQMKYGRTMAELKAISDWLEIHRGRIEARYMKNYERMPKTFTAREITAYLGGERDIVEIKQLEAQANLLYSQLREIVESFKQMSWMVGHITKLHVASMQEALI